MSQLPRILITGATGNIGKELAKYLSEKGIPFRAMVRSIVGTKDLHVMPGVTIIEGDFNDKKSLEVALRGVENAFLLTNSSELAERQQCAFVEVAARAGVKHIVKLSQWAADVHSPVRFLRYHAVVEQLIRESGITYTFLRPNLFMQGLLGFRETIMHQGQFYGAVGDSKISLVDVRDIAEAAGEALTKAGHENKIYNLTGPEALSHYELAEKLSMAVGREVRFVDVSPDALREMLLGVGFPEWQAEGLVEDYAHYKAGEAAEIVSDVFEATGHRPRSFEEFVKDYATYFI